jgi:hypothetical protein
MPDGPGIAKRKNSRFSWLESGNNVLPGREPDKVWKKLPELFLWLSMDRSPGTLWTISVIDAPFLFFRIMNAPGMLCELFIFQSGKPPTIFYPDIVSANHSHNPAVIGKMPHDLFILYKFPKNSRAKPFFPPGRAALFYCQVPARQPLP